VSDQSGVRTRLRIHFGKRGPLRYTSHLDLARIWERLLRRAGVDVVYSQGFNPRPKIQLAAALPLGYTSTCEVLDVWLAGDGPVSLQDFRLHLQATVPQGLEVQRVEVVDVRGPALQTLTRAATYEITFLDTIDLTTLRRGVAHILSADKIIRERRNKRYDLRLLIQDLSVDENKNGEVRVPRLVATLSLGETGTGRPDELLAALGLDATQFFIERVAIDFAAP
jgi:radical SAM-linked protein